MAKRGNKKKVMGGKANGKLTETCKGTSRLKKLSKRASKTTALKA